MKWEVKEGKIIILGKSVSISDIMMDLDIERRARRQGKKIEKEEGIENRTCYHVNCKHKISHDQYLDENINYNKKNPSVINQYKYLVKLWNSKDIEFYCCSCVTKIELLNKLFNIPFSRFNQKASTDKLINHNIIHFQQAS